MRKIYSKLRLEELDGIVGYPSNFPVVKLHYVSEEIRGSSEEERLRFWQHVIDDGRKFYIKVVHGWAHLQRVPVIVIIGSSNSNREC